MDNARFLKIIIVVLLLINIGTLAAIWLMRPTLRLPPPQGPQIQGPPGRAAAEYLIRELQFDEAQKKQYEILIQEQQQLTGDIHESSKDFHKSFFDLLHNNSPDTIKAKALAERIGHNHALIEMAMFKHFMKVRAICHPEQQVKFDAIIDDALNLMMPPPPGPPHP